MSLLVEVDTRDARKAKAVALALAGDARPKRGKVSFRARGTWLVMDMDCEDAVATRAAANSSLRLADACLSILR